MKRLHIHIAVKEMKESIGFYSALFGAIPGTIKNDYAKWELENPSINLAISTGGNKSGIDHLGVEVDTPAELEEIRSNLERADIQSNQEEAVSCCYAKSDKHWTLDPQRVAWESFLTKAESDEHCSGGVEVSNGQVSCCVPTALDRNDPEGKCCVPSPESSCCS